jgi:hypothetical protein
MRRSLFLLFILMCCTGCDDSPDQPALPTGECLFNGSLSCDGNKLQMCVLSAWIVQDECPQNHTCMSRSWTDDAGLEVSTAYCANGEVTDQACDQPDEVACIDNTIHRCLKVDATGKLGAWWIVRDCSPDETCTTDSFTHGQDTVSEAGFCVLPNGLGAPCDQPGASKCVDLDIHYCGPHFAPMWFSWMRLETCVIGTDCIEEEQTNFAGDTVTVASCQERL